VRRGPSIAYRENPAAAAAADEWAESSSKPTEVRAYARKKPVAPVQQSAPRSTGSRFFVIGAVATLGVIVLLAVIARSEIAAFFKSIF